MTAQSYLAVAFFVAAFLVALTCMVYSLIRGRYDKLHKKLYLWMLSILLLNSLGEIGVIVLRAHAADSDASLFWLQVLTLLYFLTHTMLLPLIGYYVMSVNGMVHRFKGWSHFVFNFPVFLLETLFTTNMFHHLCYTFEGAERVYTRGPGVTALYVISGAYIVFCAAVFFTSFLTINRARRIALGYFLAVTVAGVLLQAAFSWLRVELLADALAFMGLMLTVEDESDLVNNDTGVYNRRALQLDWDTLAAAKKPFHVIVLKVENSDIIRRVTGLSDPTVLTDLLLDQLVRYLPRCHIYQASGDTLVMLLVRESHTAALSMANHISERFEKSWHCGDAEIMLHATVMLARVPEDIDSSGKLFDMTDTALPQIHSVRLYGKENLTYLLRRREVETAIQRGLDQSGFEVYYQPTFHTDGLTVKGAEALIRLHDAKMGNVYPDEFIPLAEEIGLIGQVDDFVLRNVCRFINSGAPRREGIDSINVNLSVQQCVQPGFVDHITSIVRESGADRSQISFEITESVEASDYGVLETVIREFKKQGFQVYMDDFGTGFSNMRALFAMDFDIIKVDKSLLWGAEKSELGLIILSNNIRMLKQMGLGVLVEGVETKEQIDLLTKLGVDYLQGFYFSRPIPEKELVAFLQNRKQHA